MAQAEAVPGPPDLPGRRWPTPARETSRVACLAGDATSGNAATDAAVSAVGRGPARAHGGRRRAYARWLSGSTGSRPESYAARLSRAERSPGPAGARLPLLWIVPPAVSVDPPWANPRRSSAVPCGRSRGTHSNAQAVVGQVTVRELGDDAHWRPAGSGLAHKELHSSATRWIGSSIRLPAAVAGCVGLLHVQHASTSESWCARPGLPGAGAWGLSRGRQSGQRRCRRRELPRLRKAVLMGPAVASPRQRWRLGRLRAKWARGATAGIPTYTGRERGGGELPRNTAISWVFPRRGKPRLQTQDSPSRCRSWTTRLSARRGRRCAHEEVRLNRRLAHRDRTWVSARSCSMEPARPPGPSGDAPGAIDPRRRDAVSIT
jgi:hypothetical protein